MPRPSITMVFHRSSRSSKVAAAGPDGEVTSAHGELDASSSLPSAQSNDSSIEKRIRKPSQRMLEALQDDSDVPTEKTAATSSLAKGKRKASPVPQVPAPLRPKRARTAKAETHVADDATPEATLETFGFTTPDKAPAKKSRRGSETEESVASASVSPAKKADKAPTIKKKSQTTSRTRSQLHDSLYVPEESVPSSSATEGETTEATETSADEGSVSPKQVKKLKIKVTKPSAKVESTAHAAVQPAQEVSLDQPGSISLDVQKSKKKKTSSQPVAEIIQEPASVVTTDSSAGLADEPSGLLNDASLSSERRLTARQRAKLYGAEEHLIKLEDPRAKTPPPDYLEKKEERNKKRRAQAASRREELKTETVQKLLHKAPSAKKGTKAEDSSAKRLVKYVINKTGTTVFYPEAACPMERMPPISIPAFVKCGVTGCKNAKKYSCSKTGVPLCSLECYKKNQNRRGSSRVK